MMQIKRAHIYLIMKWRQHFGQKSNAGGRTAIVVELKYNQSPESAIKQIKEKRYHVEALLYN